jgi:hypothetical protein
LRRQTLRVGGPASPLGRAETMGADRRVSRVRRRLTAGPAGAQRCVFVATEDIVTVFFFFFFCGWVGAVRLYHV